MMLVPLKTALSRSYILLVFAMTLGSIKSSVIQSNVNGISTSSSTQAHHSEALFRYYHYLFSTRSNYYQSPCDANVLVNCISSSSNDDDVFFVDLDQISLSSFTKFSGNQSRLLLFYEPNRFMDQFFFVTTTTTTTSSNNSNSMTWFSSNETLSVMEPIIGRVNCIDYPDLCSESVHNYDRNNGPTLLRVSPYKGNNANADTDATLDYQEEIRMKNVTLDDLLEAFTHRMQEYGTDASQCLWKRFGARRSNIAPLTRDCSYHLAATLYFQQQQQQQQHAINDTTTTISMSSSTDDDITIIKKLIQQGERIVMIWNACMIVASLVFFFGLNLAGLKLLKKCWSSHYTSNSSTSSLSNSLSSSSSRYCKNILLFQNSKSFTKQQRKAQLQQLMYCFYMAAIMVGLTNMFLPFNYIIIAGPIAIISLLWLWYKEFHCCCTPISSFCCAYGDCSTTSSSSSSAVTTKYGSVQLTQQEMENVVGGDDEKQQQQQVALLLLPEHDRDDDNGA